MADLSLLKRLEQDVVLVAEGYLFELERRGYLKAGPYVPEVVLKHPNAVRELHEEFMRAGSDVCVAFTYYGHRAKMKSVGLEDGLEDLNLAALELARAAADAYGGLMAGNLCNTWEYDPERPDESARKVRAMFDEQAQWAKAAGADYVVAETFSHVGEARQALEAVKAVGLPVVVTFIQTTQQTCDGYDLAEACRIMAAEGADVVGLNCARGPETMLPTLERVRAAVDGPVAALPVPFRTTQKTPTLFQFKDISGGPAFPGAMDPFLLTRYEMADFAATARDMGVNYIGVCCGGAPHHVRAMAEALGREAPASENSPDISMHPAHGDGPTASKDHARECWFAPEFE